eukprot:586640-Rhodomonas_salina.5
MLSRENHPRHVIASHAVGHVPRHRPGPRVLDRIGSATVEDSTDRGAFARTHIAPRWVMCECTSVSAPLRRVLWA